MKRRGWALTQPTPYKADRFLPTVYCRSNRSCRRKRPTAAPYSVHLTGFNVFASTRSANQSVPACASLMTFCASATTSFADFPGIFGRHQRFVPGPRPAFVLRGHILVARAACQAVFFPDSGHGQDVDLEDEIANHPANNRQLLKIFSPNTAASGSRMWNNFPTTVQTPRKCPGRDLPSSVLDNEASSTNVEAIGRINLVG